MNNFSILWFTVSNSTNLEQSFPWPAQVRMEQEIMRRNGMKMEMEKAQRM